jgi:hypothetical protein
MTFDLNANWARYLKSQQRKRFGVPDNKLIYCIGEDFDASPVKIGLTKDVDARLGQLSIHNWRDLKVYWHLEGGHFHEMQLHQLLGAARIRGEWFRDDDGRIKRLASIAQLGSISDLIHATHSEVTL